MFRSRLHPTPSGFALGIVMIALWALLWVWFIAHLAGGPRTATARSHTTEPEVTFARLLVDAAG